MYQREAVPLHPFSGPRSSTSKANEFQSRGRRFNGRRVSILNLRVERFQLISIPKRITFPFGIAMSRTKFVHKLSRDENSDLTIKTKVFDSLYAYFSQLFYECGFRIGTICEYVGAEFNLMDLVFSGIKRVASNTKGRNSITDCETIRPSNSVPRSAFRVEEKH